MFARSETSRSSNTIRLALLIGFLGALLVVIGLFNMRSGTDDSWQPLNEDLNAVLGDADSAQPLADATSPTSSESKSPSSNDAPLQGTASINKSASASADTTHMPKTNGELSTAAQDNPTANTSPSADGSSSALVTASDGRIDINHATAQQLDELPGIGPAKASAIVADREANGPFRSVDDLDRVKGIGAKMIEKLRASVVALP